jgi:hypothetical protein
VGSTQRDDVEYLERECCDATPAARKAGEFRIGA